MFADKVTEIYCFYDILFQIFSGYIFCEIFYVNIAMCVKNMSTVLWNSCFYCIFAEVIYNVYSIL